jgi:hypothetical protein
MGNLTSTERQIVWASGAVVILALYSIFTAWGGLMFVPLLAGLAALVILFLPSIAPNTKAPGSKGSLLMVSGVLAALFWLLAFLYWLSYIFNNFVSFDVILFLIGFAAALWFGWLCWSAFQAEGGKFQFGNTDMGGAGAGGAASAGGAAAAAAPPAESPPATPSPAAPPPASPPPASPPPATPPPTTPPAASPPPAASADSGMTPPPSGDTGSGQGGGQG